MDEKQIQHYTDVLCAMLETMDFSLDKQEDGNYCLVDEQGAYLGDMESYEDFEEGSAAAIVDRLGTYLNDYYFEDLEEIAEDDFNIDFSKPDVHVPADAEDWVKFMDEHEDFRKACFHEYEVMKLISSPEILDSINLDDVVQHFSPKKIVIAQPIEGVTLNGLEYLCDDDGRTLRFADENEAKAYLFEKGYTEQSIQDEGIVIKEENLLDAVYSQEDIAQFDETAKQLEAYKKYKEEWIKTNVSETDMIATEAAYENDEEAKDMTFEEYVEEYGFANGMIYVCFDEFLESEYKEFSEKNEHESKQTILEITAESIDIEDDIQISDDYDKLDVYVVMDDQTLDTLMKRADLYEKSGYKDFDEILESSALVNSYFVADEKGVNVVLVLDDGEKYHDVTFSEHPDENEFPLSHDESEMIKEKLEKFLGKPVAEYLKAEKDESLESEYAETDESRSPAKPQWQNFGSPDYLNEGGVQLKMIPHLDERFDIEAIVLSPNPEDSNSMYAGYVPLDHLDIASCRNNQEFMEFHGLDENSTVEEIAVALAEENSKQGLGFPLEGNSYEPVDKIALGHKLQGEIGIDVSESLERLEAERAGLDLE